MIFLSVYDFCLGHSFPVPCHNITPAGREGLEWVIIWAIRFCRYGHVLFNILSEYRLQHGAIGPLYVTSSYSTWIFCRRVSGFATDCPCDVWCRGLTTCLLHVGPPFGNRFLNTSWAVGLTYWIVYLHIFCILAYAIIYVLIHHIIFFVLSLLLKHSLFFQVLLY